MTTWGDYLAYGVIHVGKKARVWISGQQTRLLQEKLSIFLSTTTVDGPIKAALPPFNLRVDVDTRFDLVGYNAPVFGLAIADATMKLFDGEQMAAFAAELGLRLPRYSLSTFVQQKMFKVRDLIAAAKAHPDAKSATNTAAIARLEQFVTAFERLRQDEVSSLEDWRKFVDKFVVCPGEWGTKLHFDHLLCGCFGFEAALSLQLQAQTLEKTAITLQHWSMRWLSSALCAYGPNGCLGDVVNLVLAMLFPTQPNNLSESMICAALENFSDLMQNHQALRQAFTSGSLWFPTHFQHDAEMDDTLCWLLLERLSRILNRPSPKVLVQLPTGKEFHSIAQHMRRKGASVFFDADSHNAKAVLENLNHLI